MSNSLLSVCPLQRPLSARLHAVLGKPDERPTRRLKKDHIANLINFYAQFLDKLDNHSICVSGFK